MFFFLIYRTNISLKQISIAVLIAIIFIVGIFTAYNFGLKKENQEPSHKLYQHGAVAANGKECADIGVLILKKNGSVADAAISTMLCEGVTCEFNDNSMTMMSFE